jgi:predicted DNA-binding transcriptional regulator YafY
MASWQLIFFTIQIFACCYVMSLRSEKKCFIFTPMNNKHALTRYRLLDSRINMKQKPAPTLEELVNYVSEKLGSPISVSIIQKDIYAMRYNEALGYFAPLEYSMQHKGYIYTQPNYSINHIPVSEEDLQGLEIAVGILEQFKEIPAIKIFDDAIQKIAVAVKQSRDKTVTQGSKLILERPKRYQGIEYMADIVEAIHEKKVLRFLYQPFTKKEGKKHTVHPYFIKEYNNRMYLIGKDIHPTKEAKFLIFGFDRMHDVLKMNQRFQEEDLNIDTYFNSTIGISLPNSKPEKIVLQFNPLQASYLKSQALHHSQKIIRDTKNELKLSLELVINYELRAMLLSFGHQVKVLKPLALAQEVQQIAKEMVKMYTEITSN